MSEDTVTPSNQPDNETSEATPPAPSTDAVNTMTPTDAPPVGLTEPVEAPPAEDAPEPATAADAPAEPALGVSRTVPYNYGPNGDEASSDRSSYGPNGDPVPWSGTYDVNGKPE